MVHRYQDFENQCLEGVEDQITYGADWAGGFATPEEAHTWLEENRLEDGDEKQVTPGCLARNRKHITRCIFTVVALFMLSCSFSISLAMHRYYCGAVTPNPNRTVMALLTPTPTLQRAEASFTSSTRHGT